LRDLDKINAVAVSTGYLFRISLILPIFMGAISFTLATGSAPGVPLGDNYLAISGILISLIGIISLPISYLFQWDWRTKFCGASLFGLASFACLGIYPLLCIVFYSHMNIWIKIVIVFAEAIAICLWCARFVKIYRFIYNDKEIFDSIYFGENSVVYYRQKENIRVVEHRLKFSETPPGWSFLVCLVLAFCPAILKRKVIEYVGLPITHVILAIGTIPITLWVLGIATKMWLIYFTYPAKILSKSGKRTYLDMNSEDVPRMVSG
jgi:hypothetical protein